MVKQFIIIFFILISNFSRANELNINLIQELYSKYGKVNEVQIRKVLRVKKAQLVEAQNRLKKKSKKKVKTRVISEKTVLEEMKNAFDFISNEIPLEGDGSHLHKQEKNMALIYFNKFPKNQFESNIKSLGKVFREDNLKVAYTSLFIEQITTPLFLDNFNRMIPQIDMLLNQVESDLRLAHKVYSQQIDTVKKEPKKIEVVKEKLIEPIIEEKKTIGKVVDEVTPIPSVTKYRALNEIQKFGRVSVDEYEIFIKDYKSTVGTKISDEEVEEIVFTLSKRFNKVFNFGKTRNNLLGENTVINFLKYRVYDNEEVSKYLTNINAVKMGFSGVYTKKNKITDMPSYIIKTGNIFHSRPILMYLSSKEYIINYERMYHDVSKYYLLFNKGSLTIDKSKINRLKKRIGDASTFSDIDKYAYEFFDFVKTPDITDRLVDSLSFDIDSLVEKLRRFGKIDNKQLLKIKDYSKHNIDKIFTIKNIMEEINFNEKTLNKLSTKEKNLVLHLFENVSSFDRNYIYKELDHNSDLIGESFFYGLITNKENSSNLYYYLRSAFLLKKDILETVNYEKLKKKGASFFGSFLKESHYSAKITTLTYRLYKLSRKYNSAFYPSEKFKPYIKVNIDSKNLFSYFENGLKNTELFLSRLKKIDRIHNNLDSLFLYLAVIKDNELLNNFINLYSMIPKIELNHRRVQRRVFNFQALKRINKDNIDAIIASQLEFSSLADILNEEVLNDHLFRRNQIPGPYKKTKNSNKYTKFKTHLNTNIMLYKFKIEMDKIFGEVAASKILSENVNDVLRNFNFTKMESFFKNIKYIKENVEAEIFNNPIISRAMINNSFFDNQDKTIQYLKEHNVLIIGDISKNIAAYIQGSNYSFSIPDRFNSFFKSRKMNESELVFTLKSFRKIREYLGDDVFFGTNKPVGIFESTFYNKILVHFDTYIQAKNEFPAFLEDFNYENEYSKMRTKLKVSSKDLKTYFARNKNLKKLNPLELFYYSNKIIKLIDSLEIDTPLMKERIPKFFLRNIKLEDFDEVSSRIINLNNNDKTMVKSLESFLAKYDSSMSIISSSNIYSEKEIAGTPLIETKIENFIPKNISSIENLDVIVNVEAPKVRKPYKKVVVHKRIIKKYTTLKYLGNISKLNYFDFDHLEEPQFLKELIYIHKKLVSILKLDIEKMLVTKENLSLQVFKNIPKEGLADFIKKLKEVSKAISHKEFKNIDSLDYMFASENLVNYNSFFNQIIEQGSIFEIEVKPGSSNCDMLLDEIDVFNLFKKKKKK